MNENKIKNWFKENGLEIVTFLVEGTIVTVSFFIVGQRKAKAMIFIGSAELLRLMIGKYFKKFNPTT